MLVVRCSMADAVAAIPMTVRTFIQINFVNADSIGNSLDREKLDRGMWPMGHRVCSVGAITCILINQDWRGVDQPDHLAAARRRSAQQLRDIEQLNGASPFATGADRVR
jgi:hypothetical protein